MSALTISDDTFDSLVLEASSPILVDVWAPWCGPCKMVGPAAERVASKHPELFQLAMANMEDFSNTAASLNIKATPTLLVFTNGKEIGRRTGALLESQIEKWLLELCGS